VYAAHAAPAPTPAQGLTRRLRAAIKEQRLPDWVRSYIKGMFPHRDVPQWAVDALDVAGISLPDDICDKRPAHDFDRELRDGAYRPPGGLPG
jgi:hypothetical protein